MGWRFGFENAIQDLNPGDTNNATYIQFDFVPLAIPFRSILYSLLKNMAHFNVHLQMPLLY